MEDIESRTPLAAAPQAQYFDISDVSSTSSEEIERPVAHQGSDDDEAELEVFDSHAKPAKEQPEADPDPFGLKQLEAQQASAAPPPPQNGKLPVATFFEGQGLPATSAKASADEYDDEFDYAFEGQARQGATHKHVFEANNIPVPKGLLTDLKGNQLGSALALAAGNVDVDGMLGSACCSLCEEEEDEEAEAEEGNADSLAGLGTGFEPAEDEWESATLKVKEQMQEAPFPAEMRHPTQHVQVRRPYTGQRLYAHR
eukprot:scaffold26959_cov32-Prasinocladus_malaysianus.AAC.1